MAVARARSVLVFYAGGQCFLVGPRSDFPLNPNFHARPFDQAIQLIAREGSQMALLRAQCGADAGSGTAEDAGSWLRNAVELGRISIVPVPDTILAAGYSGLSARTLRVPELSVGNAAVLNQSPPNIRSLSTYSKVFEVLLRSIPYLPQETRQEFLNLISPAALKAVAGALVTWAGSQAIAVGEAVDVTLLGTGFALAGWSAFDGIESMSKGVTLGASAGSSEELEVASEHFAHGLAQLGIKTILILLARMRRNGAVAVGEADASVIARWQIYIAGLELRFDGSRAALWSRLGDKGERAASLARAEGRTTLETVLKDTGFLDRYLAEFGDMRSTVTARIWQLISEKYASQLKGSVTVYTDQLRLRGGEPQLGAELLEILDRPLVNGVVFKDVTNPSLSLVWTRADLARARGSAPRSGIWH